MTDTSVLETHEDLREMKVALQRAGFLARERPLDDYLDSETWTALFLFAESRGIDWDLEAFEDEDGEIPEEVVEALLSPMARSFAPAADDEGELVMLDDAESDCDEIDLDAHEVFDLTQEHELDTRKARRWPRKPEQITTIVLHQTGIEFGVGRRALETYGRRVGLHRRFYKVACHAAALRNGDVLLVNPWQRYVLHGHSSNRFSIGIEIEGLYPGLEHDPGTVSGKREPSTLTKRTIGAARKAVQISVERCRELGCPITKIAAHRQYHGSRISDPGQGIWREVGLWAVETLDLEVDYDYARNNRKTPRKSGRQIPREWDPAGKVDYRGRL